MRACEHLTPRQRGSSRYSVVGRRFRVSTGLDVESRSPGAVDATPALSEKLARGGGTSCEDW